MNLYFQQPQHMKQLQQYELTEQQLKNTMHPIDCIALAEHDAERSNIVVMDGDECVAFFVLHIGEGLKRLSENKHGILLRAFSVDNRFAGQGIGTAVLKQLPNFIRTHFPTKNEITLTVNCQNDRAIHLYKKMNYTISGPTIEGKNGPLYVMHYRL